MEMIGGSSASYLSRTPCVPLFCAMFSKGGNRRAFRLPWEGGDHSHCTVEPSSGHIRCRFGNKFPPPLMCFQRYDRKEPEGKTQRAGQKLLKTSQKKKVFAEDISEDARDHFYWILEYFWTSSKSSRKVAFF